MRWSALWLVGMLVAAGCSSDREDGPESSPATADSTHASPVSATAAHLPCQDMLFTDLDPPEDYEIILDVVALPTSATAQQALQVGPRSEDAPFDYFAKTGLLVRSGAVFALEVENPRDGAAIGWGSSSLSGELASQGCDGEDWIAFAGGFFVAEPMCVRLRLTASNKRETFSVGAGAACAGQEPPATP